MSDLKKIAEKIKNNHPIAEESTPMGNEVETNIESLEYPEMDEFEIPEDESVVINAGLDMAEDDDDETVVIGGISTNSSDGDSIGYDVDDLLEDEDFFISDDELKAEMPDLDDETFLEASSKIKGDIDKYRKNLIIHSGFTIDEANQAAINRMKKLGKEENDAYLEENPTLGIIEIGKKDADNLEFTPEEREKMVKVKTIKLQVVEDVDLKTIEVERVDKKHKETMLQSLDTNLSHYSVPLPLMNDYCRFKGSQIVQLIQAVKYEDATLDEVIAKKASLVYSQLAGGANLKKYDDKGKVVMSYQDFINKFLFHDLDMALYGILVASSMEEIETTLTCGSCGGQFQWKYNLKSLLTMDDLSDDFKEKFDDILGNKMNEEYLQDLFKENHKSIRVKSPITNNIYELNYPTVARAINLYRLIDENDETMVYLSAFGLFISDLYVYNKKSGKYIQVEETEYKNLLNTLQMLPQEELDIMQKFISPRMYRPQFILQSECAACGHKMKNNLTIDNLVFLKARDSSTEIQ